MTLLLHRFADIGGGLEVALCYHGADPAWRPVFLDLAERDGALRLADGRAFWICDTSIRDGDPDLLADMLEIQVARFPDRMARLYERAVQGACCELALVRLVLAGLTPPPCAEKQPLHTTLASAHGRLRIRSTYGPLAAFLGRQQAGHSEALRREIAGEPAPS